MIVQFWLLLSSQKNKTSPVLTRPTAGVSLSCYGPLLSFGRSSFFISVCSGKVQRFYFCFISSCLSSCMRPQLPWKSRNLSQVMTTGPRGCSWRRERKVGWVLCVMKPVTEENVTLQLLLVIPGCNLYSFLSKCMLRQMLADQPTSRSYSMYNHQPEQGSYFIILNSHTHLNLILVLVVNKF